MRQQTYWFLAPHLKQGHGYQRFKRDWQFGWETINIPEIRQPTPAEMEALKLRHLKYVKKK